MSAGMILLTVVVIIFLVIVALPIVGGGICGSVVLMRDALWKMRAKHKVSETAEKSFSQEPHLSVLK